MRPTASLPMYNLPEMQTVNACFWDALRGLLVDAGLRDVPESLTFDRLPVPERIGHPNAERTGIQAAEAIGIESRRLLKNAYGRGRRQAGLRHRPLRSCSQHEKAGCRVSRQSSEHDASRRRRTVDWLPRRGGISPFGQKKRVPVVLNAAVSSERTVFVNGGQRGVEIELKPNDISKALDAIVHPLTA